MTGKELREKREMYGETQEKAALRMGVSKRTLIRWEAQEGDIPKWASDKVTGDKVTLEVTEGDKVTSGSVTSDIRVTSVGDTEVASYVPLLEASILEEQGKQLRQMAELMKAMGGQVSEMKEAVDLLRHRVKAAEDGIKELKARPQTMTGALIEANIREGGVRSFPKPRSGWRSYDKPGGDR